MATDPYTALTQGFLQGFSTAKESRRSDEDRKMKLELFQMEKEKNKAAIAAQQAALEKDKFNRAVKIGDTLSTTFSDKSLPVEVRQQAYDGYGKIMNPYLGAAAMPTLDFQAIDQEGKKILDGVLNDISQVNTLVATGQMNPVQGQEHIMQIKKRAERLADEKKIKTYSGAIEEVGKTIKSEVDFAQEIRKEEELKKRGLGRYDPEGAEQIKDPASVMEFKFFKKLSGEDQTQFLNLQRAGKVVDLGDRIGVVDPSDPTKIAASFQKDLPPEREPSNVAAEAQAKATGTAVGAGNYEQYNAATAAVSNIAKIDDLITEIESSEAITGFGAEVLKNIERVKAKIGSDVATGKVQDTEILDVMMGSEVFPLIKELGVGARGMDTPAEREFMRQVLTGSISLNKGTLLKMAQIRKSIAQRAIDRWNTRTDKGELDKFYEASDITKETIGQPPPPEDYPDARWSSKHSAYFVKTGDGWARVKQ